MNDPTIRTARVDELATLISIDEDASTLYAESGIALTLAATHPFSVAERALWQSSLEQGFVYLAVEAAHDPAKAGAAHCDALVALASALAARKVALEVNWAWVRLHTGRDRGHRSVG